MQPAAPTDALPTPTYHRDLAEHFEQVEPELWSWFGESSALAERRDEAAELALLKSAYRLDGGPHAVLVGFATMLATRFGIGEPIVLYQALGDNDRNARVFRLNSQVHVVFSGDLLDLLDTDELHAVLAHELAHIALWKRDGGRYFALDHLVERLAGEIAAPDALVETARRLRLHTEVWADAMAVDAVQSVAATVSTIVKVNTGLRHVDPDAYLRQATQILEMDGGASQAWSHPELHIRVACIEARARSSADGVIDELINGPDDLDRIDLLGQARVQAVSARVLNSGAAVANRSEAVAQYLAGYPELAVSAAGAVANGELIDAEPSIRWLAAALLVDLTLADGGTDTLDDVRALAREAERQGVAIEFDKILAKATEQTPAQVRAFRGATR